MRDFLIAGEDELLIHLGGHSNRFLRIHKAQTSLVVKGRFAASSGPGNS